MNRAQMHRFQTSGDRPPTHPSLQELTTGNHAMLPIGELGDRDVRVPTPARPPNRLFGTYVVLNVRLAGHGPIVAASV
jgi:hypothetical protein